LNAQLWSAALFHANWLVAAEPASARSRRDRGYACARLGRWAEAVAEYGRVAELAPDDLEFGFEYAAVLVLAGQDRRYREYCAGLIANAHRGLAPRDAYLAGRICALAPGAVPDPGVPVGLGERAVEAEPKLARHLHGLGLAHYRAGQFGPAIRRLNESLAADPAWRAQVLNRYALALAYQADGQGDEARKWYGQAARTRPPPLQSHDALAYLILRREADQLLGAGKQ
jgi:Flp pilus assembly protein TadD